MEKERMNEIGLRVLAFRSSLGLTQKQFSEKVSLTQQQISRIENGETLITTELIFKLYDLFCIDPSYFLIGESGKKLDSCMEIFVDWYLNLEDEKKNAACRICESIMDLINGR